MQDSMILVSASALESLERDSLKLSMLEAHGVDNWCGYDDAMYDFKLALEEEQ